MYWPAFSGSALVHVAGALAAFLGADLSALGGVHPADGGGVDAGMEGAAPYPGGLVTVDAPQLFLVGPERPVGGYSASEFPGGRHEGWGCPAQRPVDRAAMPDFPYFGDEGPFTWLPPTPESPAFCVLIAADGRVARLFLPGTSGDARADAALRWTVRRLRFRAAGRRGALVSAWHRLIVNQRAGLPDARAELEALPRPPPPVESIELPRAPTP
jgi:hypothetical protein